MKAKHRIARLEESLTETAGTLEHEAENYREQDSDVTGKPVYQPHGEALFELAERARRVLAEVER